MMAHTPIGKTTFCFAFFSEVVILTEVGLTSYKVAYHDKRRNEEQMLFQLDLLDEVRVMAEQQITHYQDLMAKHYNTKAKSHFQVEDLFLRNVTIATKDPMQGKLGPSWEGPYRIIDYHRKGSNHLETLDGQRFHHPWNTEHLRRYYPQ